MPRPSLPSRCLSSGSSAWYLSEGPHAAALADALCWAGRHRQRVFGGQKRRHTTELEDSAQLHGDSYTPLALGSRQAGGEGPAHLPPRDSVSVNFKSNFLYYQHDWLEPWMSKLLLEAGGHS